MKIQIQDEYISYSMYLFLTISRYMSEISIRYKKYIDIIFNFDIMKNITGLYVYKNIKIHSIQRSTFFTCIHISHILRCNLFCKFIVNKIFISYIFFHMYKYFNQKRISFHLQFIQCSIYFFTQI